MEERPLISIVIVTWNRKQDVLEALRSIAEQEYRPVETVVVDNASTDGTVDAIRAQYPDVTLIPLSENVGISAGRNPGFKAAHGSIIFIMDSDATLEQDTLTRIAERFASEPKLGIITCKFINGQTHELDEITWIFTQQAKADQDVEFKCSTFCSAGVAIRKAVFDKVGLFWDQLYFKRSEDEFSIRTLDADFDILYFPQAVVTHHVSPRGRVGSGDREYFDLRNALYIYLIHFPVWMILRIAPLKIVSSLVRGVRDGFLRRDLCALLTVAKSFRMLMQRRKPIQDATAHRYLEMQRERGSLSWGLRNWLRSKT